MSEKESAPITLKSSAAVVSKITSAAVNYNLRPAVYFFKRLATILVFSFVLAIVAALTIKSNAQTKTSKYAQSAFQRDELPAEIRDGIRDTFRLTPDTLGFGAMEYAATEPNNVDDIARLQAQLEAHCESAGLVSAAEKSLSYEIVFETSSFRVRSRVARNECVRNVILNILKSAK